MVIFKRKFLSLDMTNYFYGVVDFFFKQNKQATKWWSEVTPLSTDPEMSPTENKSNSSYIFSKKKKVKQLVEL